MMENKAKVSVVIPAYNQSQYLGAAIESVLAQTYRDFEIIVVDDGSTDDTAAVVRRFGTLIRHIRQENQGLAAARNAGIRQAHGEYIALLDSDDKWLPAYLQTMMSLTGRTSDSAVFYCAARCMDAAGVDLPQLFEARLQPTKALYKTLLRANFLVPSAVIVRRSAMLRVGLFDSTFYWMGLEDWDLWLRLLRQEYSWAGSPECLVRYRIHTSSLSNNFFGMQQAYLEVVQKLFGTDDGQWKLWTEEKRRAYGGAYRYLALTHLMRGHDWKKCAKHLRRAFHADPTLAHDLDLFYELALGTQPLGYRGTSVNLDLEANAAYMRQLLKDVFCPPAPVELVSLRRRTCGMALYALGIVAYNVGQLNKSRRFLIEALCFQPDLCGERQFAATLVKSFVGRSGLRQLRRLRAATIRSGRNNGHTIQGTC